MSNKFGAEVYKFRQKFLLSMGYFGKKNGTVLGVAVFGRPVFGDLKKGERIAATGNVLGGKFSIFS